MIHMGGSAKFKEQIQGKEVFLDRVLKKVALRRST